tara:strand:- start:362 stop:472 length:111 start_codon:yes stop_codon:yes gene_type:complete
MGDNGVGGDVVVVVVAVNAEDDVDGKDDALILLFCT